MIELSTPPAVVNPDDQDVRLSRDQLYQGLVWKAQYPTLFVAPILECAILETFDDGFLREILHRNPDGSTETLQERVFLDPTDSVTFLRLRGSVVGQITNLIETDHDGGLTLRFSFTLALAGAAHGSREEVEYEEGFSRGYVDAVHATLDATRKFVRTGEDPTRILADSRAAELASTTPAPDMGGDTTAQ